jgi:hypothetical protein
MLNWVEDIVAQNCQIVAIMCEKMLFEKKGLEIFDLLLNSYLLILKKLPRKNTSVALS